MLRFATSLDYLLAIKCGRSLLIRPFLTALNTNTMYERIWSGFLLIRSVANWTLMRAFSRFFVFVVHKASFSCMHQFISKTTHHVHQIQPIREDFLREPVRFLVGIQEWYSDNILAIHLWGLGFDISPGSPVFLPSQPDTINLIRFVR